jgi:hypothetical protein
MEYKIINEKLSIKAQLQKGEVFVLWTHTRARIQHGLNPYVKQIILIRNYLWCFEILCYIVTKKIFNLCTSFSY